MAKERDCRTPAHVPLIHHPQYNQHWLCQCGHGDYRHRFNHDAPMVECLACPCTAFVPTGNAITTTPFLKLLAKAQYETFGMLDKNQGTGDIFYASAACAAPDGSGWWLRTRFRNKTYCTDQPVHRDSVMNWLVNCGPNPRLFSWVAFPRNPTFHAPPWLTTDPDKAAPHCSGYVYFTQAIAGGPIKIGWAAQIGTRLAKLQHYSPVPLQLLLAKHGTINDEHSIHADLHQHRLHGEWFHDNPAVRAYMKQVRLDFRYVSEREAEMEAMRASLLAKQNAAQPTETEDEDWNDD